ncbi:hypothetical protein chiPu_0019514 [Chiloscyllium punctatum]|uniref:Uncharacterized protein n=1 Tax=Chiloscyllium punctatum TaxID=137246 RepID=A0A401RSB5_CHIPU|nr:hypothetical protein [Chiloscyllium punctatum]
MQCGHMVQHGDSIWCGMETRPGVVWKLDPVWSGDTARCGMETQSTVVRRLSSVLPGDSPLRTAAFS